ncbi:hypothetical protein HDA40_005452 [Hamadaea flava]|uniref:DUF2637 domain-containing protein n=1 Tax=Hamadaea flava TaxID=1742688 RepID=A0ABV8LXC3_9ACTN|nr:DUF2637 domain-containing protein [Hamadaea flava]MCP2326945.1 hypothetical protein [Hamadaea flava]
MNRVDAAIKAAAGVTVVGLAGIAGAISYSHMTELAHLHGETGWRGHMFPLSVDGIEIVASLVLLADKRAGRRSGRLPWAALVAGTGASFAANIAVGGSDWIGRAVSGWPAFALLLAVKLLFGLLEHPASVATATLSGARVYVQDTDGGRGVPESVAPIEPPVFVTASAERPAAFADEDQDANRTDGPQAPDAGASVQDRRPVRRARRTGTVDGARGGRTDRTALEEAARAIQAALTEEGTPLSRDVLAARLRDAGHTVSNERASGLVRQLRLNGVTVASAAGGEPQR